MRRTGQWAISSGLDLLLHRHLKMCDTDYFNLSLSICSFYPFSVFSETTLWINPKNAFSPARRGRTQTNPFFDCISNSKKHSSSDPNKAFSFLAYFHSRSISASPPLV
uniref:Uncharacterized protein n=1 Tax=Rhodosorus marinus TaxID=101924 RepID=A0A7S2ZS35_9RHOD